MSKKNWPAVLKIKQGISNEFAKVRWMSPLCGEDTGEEEHLVQTVQEIKVDTAVFEDKSIRTIIVQALGNSNIISN